MIYRSTTAVAPEIAESDSGLKRDSIAYNSIAAAALGDDAGELIPNRFVIEPRKVGVAMATGGVELSKVVDGLNASASYIPSAFPITLTCTSVGRVVRAEEVQWRPPQSVHDHAGRRCVADSGTPALRDVRR